MFLKLRHTFRFAPAAIASLLLSSCATYNQQVSGYYDHYVQGDYARASSALDQNKLLAKHRNHLLFLLEKGRMEHLQGHYESSNHFFNEADALMEDSHGNTIGDFAVSTLVNPMMETYRGEDFEKYMVHYYKALNYLMLEQPTEALVEARRISLRSYAQEDVAGKGKYAQDAFSFLLQGLIYEKNADVNNAFIAYRNAVDLYLQHGGSYYGVAMPEQLKKDLLRSAWQLGFQDQVDYYQRELNYTLRPEDRTASGELVLFWESGRAPVKEEESLMFFISKSGSDFFFTDSRGSLRVPFDRSFGNMDEGKLNNLSAIRAALPKYELQPARYQGAAITVDSSSFRLEAAQSINDLARLTLEERRLKDLSKTLTRIVVGKLAEAAAKPKEKKEGEKETDKEKRERVGKEFLSTGLKIFNFAKEKADTRNWQSLPGTIYYSRVPLGDSAKNVSVVVSGNGSERNYSFNIAPAKGMRFRSLYTN